MAARGMGIALECDLSVCDAGFVVLEGRWGVRLVTLDGGILILSGAGDVAVGLGLDASLNGYCLNYIEV